MAEGGECHAIVGLWDSDRLCENGGCRRRPSRDQFYPSLWRGIDPSGFDLLARVDEAESESRSSRSRADVIRVRHRGPRVEVNSIFVRARASGDRARFDSRRAREEKDDDNSFWPQRDGRCTSQMMIYSSTSFSAHTTFTFSKQTALTVQIPYKTAGVVTDQNSLDEADPPTAQINPSSVSEIMVHWLNPVHVAELGPKVSGSIHTENIRNTSEKIVGPLPVYPRSTISGTASRMWTYPLSASCQETKEGGKDKEKGTRAVGGGVEGLPHRAGERGFDVRWLGEAEYAEASSGSVSISVKSVAKQSDGAERGKGLIFK
ncbi:hypothetical protein DFH09DRAFT_1094566 [Mycena vulgaris]|nr:hypothetical protein DFH09DRAFT_1094566 [Mycena vulgaris]